MPIRAVLFDLGDTVVRLGPLPADMPVRLARRLGAHLALEDAAAQPFGAEIFDRHSALARRASDDAQRDELRIAAIVAACLAGAGHALGPELCQDVADAFGEADVARITPVSGRAALLASLRARGLRLGVVSNTTTRPELLTAMLDRFGLLSFFDALVFSSALGIRKPHPEIYDAALRAIGAAPEDTVFVGDRLREDVIGPQALGMRGILTHEFYQSPHNGEPFAIIERLEEITAVVDRC